MTVLYFIYMFISIHFHLREALVHTWQLTSVVKNRPFQAYLHIKDRGI